VTWFGTQMLDDDTSKSRKIVNQSSCASTQKEKVENRAPMMALSDLVKTASNDTEVIEIP
jgi:hypothetical protein